jgi:DNA polymerase/3'-5' exonuclease PolX
MSAQPVAQHPRMPLAEGERIAEEIFELLNGSFDRIQVVGSVRRKALTAHDVELLIEPRYETRTTDMFGGASSFNALEWRCAELLASGVFAHAQPKCWGSRLKRFVYAGEIVELFIVLPPSQWGLASVIRTGPADFSHQVVTPKGQRCSGTGRPGLMPRDLKVHDFGFYRGIVLVPTPEEDEVFALLGEAYVEPEARR